MYRRLKKLLLILILGAATAPSPSFALDPRVEGLASHYNAEHNYGIQTPHVSDKQIRELIQSRDKCLDASLRAGRDGIADCYQKEAAKFFRLYETRTHAALSHTSRELVEQLIALCPAEKLKFFQVASCQEIFHEGIKTVVDAAVTKLRNGHSGRAVFLELKEKPATHPLLAPYQQALATAAARKCPGDPANNDCLASFLMQTHYDEIHAMKDSWSATYYSSYLIQTVGACVRTTGVRNPDPRCHVEKGTLNPAEKSTHWASKLVYSLDPESMRKSRYQKAPSYVANAKSIFGELGGGSQVTGADQLTRCVRKKNEGRDLEGTLSSDELCKSILNTELLPFQRELSRAFTHVSSATFFDLIRIHSIERLLASHQRFVGRPLATLPKSCQGKIDEGFHSFQAGTSNTISEKTNEERKTFYADLRRAAKQVLALMAWQKESKLKMDIVRNAGPNYQENCDIFLEGNVGKPKCAKDFYVEATAMIERYYEAYPYFGAGRDASKIHADQPEQVRAIAKASDEQMEQVLTGAKNRLSKGIEDAIQQLCSVNTAAGGLSWVDLASLPIAQEPFWEKTYAPLKSVKECAKEVWNEDTAFRGRAKTGFLGACFIGDFATLGLMSPACLSHTALQDIDESSRKLTWLGNCRAGGNSVCTSDQVERARASFEEASLEFYSALERAGLAAATLTAGALVSKAQIASALRLQRNERLLKEITEDVRLRKITTAKEVSARLSQLEKVENPLPRFQLTPEIEADLAKIPPGRHGPLPAFKLEKPTDASIVPKSRPAIRPPAMRGLVIEDIPPASRTPNFLERPDEPNPASQRTVRPPSDNNREISTARPPGKAKGKTATQIEKHILPPLDPYYPARTFNPQANLSPPRLLLRAPKPYRTIKDLPEHIRALIPDQIEFSKDPVGLVKSLLRPGETFEANVTTPSTQGGMSHVFFIKHVDARGKTSFEVVKVRKAEVMGVTPKDSTTRNVAKECFIRDLALLGFEEDLINNVRLDGKPLLRRPRIYSTAADHARGFVRMEGVEGPEAFEFALAMNCKNNPAICQETGITLEKADDIIKTVMAKVSDKNVSTEVIQERINATAQAYRRYDGPVREFLENENLPTYSNKQLIEPGVKEDRPVGLDYNHAHNLILEPSTGLQVPIDR